MSGDADYGSLNKSELEAELEERGINLSGGTGKNGRVLVKDMAAALEADDAKVDDSESEASLATVAEAEPAPDPDPEPEAPAEEAPSEVRAGTARVPEVGEIVSYRDLFGGQRSDARVSLVHDKATVNLAVFRGSGADSKEKVTFGQDRGQWSWK